VARTTTRTEPVGGARERAIVWRHTRHAEVCERVEPWEHGHAARCDRLPDWWDYNSVRVEGADAGVDAAALVRAADGLQDGLRHRQIEVEDEAAGERLRPPFEALGWSAERLVWMARRGAGPDGPGCEEVEFALTRELRVEWARELPWMHDDAAVLRFIDHEDSVWAIRGARTLLARDDAGVPTGYVTFVVKDDAAEVEQAYVTPALRGRGIGGALVAAAVRTAGAGETFIVADDEGDSKRLYARLGFAPVWIQHVFLTRPPG
jgi:GNAT superfamily N-acetyltransferase